MFGFFYLDSSLQLTLDSGEVRFASFNFGPLINLGSGNIKVEQTRTLSSLRRFSKELGDRFASLYEKQYSKKGGKQIVDEYIESQSYLYSELKEKIVTKIDNLYNDKIIAKNEKRFLTGKVLRALKKSLSLEKSEIRSQIIDFQRNSHSFTKDIIFEGIPDPDPDIAGDFLVEITMEELLSIESNIFQLWKGPITEFRLLQRNYIMSESRNVAEKIKKMILSQDIMDITGGKVRFYPIMDIDKGVGDQFILNSYVNRRDSKYSFLPYGSYTGGNFEGGYFEVDLSNPTSEDFQVLRHIAVLMYTGKISFVMTKADNSVVTIKKTSGRTISINEMICAFNREGFLRPEDVLSEPVPGASADYIGRGGVYQILFSDDFHLSVPGHDFEDHKLFDESPSKNQLFFAIGVQSERFGMSWYINEILAGNIPHYSKLKNILGIPI